MIIFTSHDDDGAPWRGDSVIRDSFEGLNRVEEKELALWWGRLKAHSRAVHIG